MIWRDILIKVGKMDPNSFLMLSVLFWNIYDYVFSASYIAIEDTFILKGYRLEVSWN